MRDPDKDDNKKLSQILKYLSSTRDLVLTLESDGTRTAKWCVDAAFAVHHNMKIHTGGMMSMGQGALYSASIKQKLNMKSSTEAELVGVDDLMPQILLMRYFLEAQDKNVSGNVVYQDNQNAMKLEKNGRSSSGKRTRQINIRYFFVTEHIQANEMNVEYCLMEMLIIDFYTKSLQSKLFRFFRNLILTYMRKMFLQQPLRPLSTIVSLRKRALRDVTSTTT